MHDDDGHQAMLETGKAWQRIKTGQSKLWSDWTLVVGPGLVKARAEAMRSAGSNQPLGRGYNTAMGRLLHEYRLDDMSETARAHILKIMDQYPDVEQWRAKQKNAADLNHPTTVWTKYHRFASKAHDEKRKKSRRPTEVAALKATIVQLQERIQELQEENASKSGEQKSKDQEDKLTKQNNNLTKQLEELTKELESAKSGSMPPSSTELTEWSVIQGDESHISEAEFRAKMKERFRQNHIKYMQSVVRDCKRCSEKVLHLFEQDDRTKQIEEIMLNHLWSEFNKWRAA
jgi:hypothetical protein